MAGRDLENDSLRVETVCTLAQFGEVWFPEQVERLANGEPYRVYTIQEASFNQPDDPVRFTGSDIGLEPGFNIVTQNFGYGAKHPLFWDGEKPITFDEWKAAIQSGRLKPGPTVEAMRRTRGMASPYLTEEDRQRYEQFHREMSFRATQRKPLSLWERYVADFIERYELNDEQSQKAGQILRDCQSKGTQYLERRKSDFYRLQTEINSAVQTGNKDDLRRLHQKLRSLREPVEEIFEKQLKPRLERLPTRAQRQAAEAKAATQPAEPGSEKR
jgi:hypothetical protein